MRPTYQNAERLPKNDAQLSLIALGLALGGDADAQHPARPAIEQTVAEHKRAKPVRKPLPSNLPRGEIEIIPPEVERDPDAFELIRAETRRAFSWASAASATGGVSISADPSPGEWRDRDRA